MTDKQFWMKLDQLTQKKDKSDVNRQAGDIIRQAYEEDLKIIIGCVGDGEGNVQQLYVKNAGADEEAPRSRWVMCYTGPKMADGNGEYGWSKVRVRDVVDNAQDRPVIAGFVFNRHDEGRRMSVPKVYFPRDDRDQVDFIQEMAEFIRGMLPSETRREIEREMEEM